MAIEDVVNLIDSMLFEANSIIENNGASRNVGSAEYQMKANRALLIDMYSKILEWNTKLTRDLESVNRTRDTEYQAYRDHTNALMDWVDSVADAVGLSPDEAVYPTLGDILDRVKELSKNSK